MIDVTSPSPLEARRVVAKAHVLAALALRAVAEDHPGHPRTEELRTGPAAWLRETGSWALAVEPLEEAIFTSPIGGLSSGLRTDCNWASEQVATLAWTLGLAERPTEWRPMDATTATRAIGFLGDAGARHLESACLRPRDELLAYFKRVSVVRSASKEARLTDHEARSILRSMLEKRLASARLSLTPDDIESGRREVESIGPVGLAGTSSIPGLLLVRQLAVEWVLGCRGLQFWED
jgi:hypothetical protein